MILIGIDESGRGPWAGPICAAAVALAPGEHVPLHTKDSKKLPEILREEIAREIRSTLRHAVVSIPVEEIDLFGVHKANKKAFEQALEELLKAHPEIPKQESRVLIDGNPMAGCSIRRAEYFQKGEDKFSCIAAASILAKSQRDKFMRELEGKFPLYHFAKHKGYGTALHQAALKEHGPLHGVHRKSFSPIAKLLHEAPVGTDFLAVR